MLLAACIRPTPHSVVALKSAPHFKKVTTQPVVKQVETPQPQPVEQPEEQPVEVPAPEPAPAVVQVTGSCGDWLAQAGIPASASVLALIQGESGCNPYSVNRSSGACGIAQELPCGKSGCQLGDPVCQLGWMNGYVNSRYGGWDNAYATWLGRKPHWY